MDSTLTGVTGTPKAAAGTGVPIETFGLVGHVRTCRRHRHSPVANFVLETGRHEHGGDMLRPSS